MVWWRTTLVILGLLFLFLCLLPVQVHIRYERDENKDHLRIQIRTLFGLLRYTIEIPFMELVLAKNRKLKIEAGAVSGVGDQARERRPVITLPVENFIRILQNLNRLVERLHNFNHHLRKAAKTFRIVKLDWHTELGAGEASLTGAAAGIVWSIKGIVLGMVSRFFSLRVKPDLVVYPNYHSLILRTHLDCIIRFWVGQAIVAGIQMGIFMVREGSKS